jgi:hypothetical protein
MKVRRQISRLIMNIPGWHTGRKIVVFESDDWGSIRMPSMDVYNKLLQYGLRVDNCPFNKNDCLESEEDLKKLKDLLDSFRDFKGRSPVFTTNFVVCNPDFDRIKAGGFKEYFFEPFTRTYERYDENGQQFSQLKEGYNEGLFFPQFHGREHLNVQRWMAALRTGMEETLFAFENRLFGVSTNITRESRKSYMAALDFDDLTETGFQNNSLKEGAEIFKEIFGFSSESFIAPNYTWHTVHEEVLAASGIRFLQGGPVQHKPVGGSMKYKQIRHFTGQKNNYGQVFLVRNAVFEPSSDPSFDWIASALNDIETAFRLNKPAIIGSHRVNYIGSIFRDNRTKSLELLGILLSRALKKWPDIEFMSSSDLGKIISESRH